MPVGMVTNRSRTTPEQSRRLHELSRLSRRDLTASVVAAAERYLAEQGPHTFALRMLGVHLAEMACYPEALTALRAAYRRAPARQLGWLAGWIGQTHDWRGAFRLAEKWYQRAIAHDPGEASFRIFYGGMLARLGRFDEAAAVHRRAARCPRGCIDEAWHNLGLVRRAQRRYTEARRCFRRALQLDPKYREARQALADVEHVIAWLRQRKAK